MFNKVIFIGNQPLTEKVKNDFYFNDLVEENISVQYWDLSPIYFSYINFDNHFIDNCIVEISTYSLLEDLLQLQKIETTLFISTLTYEFQSLRLYKILTKYDCKTSFFARGAIPSINSNFSFSNIFFKLKKVMHVTSLFRFIKNRYAYYLKYVGLVKPHYLVFRAGSQGLNTIGAGSQIEKSYSNIIDVNSFDYDKYIKVVKSERVIEKKYCVYLDEYLPFHPDFEMLNIKVIDFKQFYKSLNYFFDLIELHFDIEVIISAHPKAAKYKENNFFNNRKIIFDKTAELTQYADFVLAHCSTSISYAVLNEKPLMMLSSNLIKNMMPSYHQIIINFSEILDGTFINVDEIDSSDLVLTTPNSKKYSNYKYNFLTSLNSQDYSSSKIFLEYINNK